MNKAPRRSKSVEKLLKEQGLRLSVQSSGRRSLAAQEVSGAGQLSEVEGKGGSDQSRLGGSAQMRQRS